MSYANTPPQKKSQIARVVRLGRAASAVGATLKYRIYKIKNIHKTFVHRNRALNI